MNRIWPQIVCGYCVVMSLAGGISTPAQSIFILQALLASIMLGLGLWRLFSFGLPTRLAEAALWLIAVILLVFLVYLLPLPAAVWQGLPGRELVIRSLALAGQDGAAQPLTLSPQGTRLDLLFLLPGVAAFVGMLSFPRDKLHWLAGSFLACALFSGVLGIVQQFQGLQSPFYLYPAWREGGAAGTFSNRNFLAAQLYTSIPLLAAFANHYIAWRKAKVWAIAIAAFIYGCILVAALAVAASRAGILLAMPAIVLSVIIFSTLERSGRRRGLVLAVVMPALAILIAGQASMVGLLRFTDVDPMSDYRVVMAQTSVETARAYFPIGAGPGTFPQVYAIAENPQLMIDRYVNHAHNDWLEIVVELGALGAGLLVAGVLWVLVASFKAWRLGPNFTTTAMQRAASTVMVLLALHSFADYPLRTPALLVLFAAMAAVMALRPAPAARARHSTQTVGNTNKTAR